jgi:Multiple myeloma tumor-associated
MAPVGRWQRGRDLNWYAKGDADEKSGETAEERAARERKEEIKRIKEAEQDALARALGYEVPPRIPNLESLGGRKEVDKILKEAIEDEDPEVGKGVGYGKFGTHHGDSTDRIQGNDNTVPQGAIGRLPQDEKDKPRRKRRRSRSRSRDRERHRRRRDKDEAAYSRRSRSRSRDRVRLRRSRSRDRNRRRDGDREWREHRRDRSRSPYLR